MAESFLLEIVTPSRKLLSREVEEVSAPAYMGEIGVLAGHAPMLTMLAPGVISYKKGPESGVIAVGRGYAEVLADKTTILVESAELDSEIDPEAARQSLTRSEDALKNLTQDDPGYQEASDAYELAQARIRKKERHKG